MVRMSGQTKEPQYQSHVEMAEQKGLARLPIRASVMWRTDPRLLVFTLSRYKFVSSDGLQQFALQFNRTAVFLDKNGFFKVNPSRVCNHHCVANEKNQMILEYLDADAAHLGFV